MVQGVSIDDDWVSSIVNTNTATGEVISREFPVQPWRNWTNSSSRNRKMCISLVAQAKIGKPDTDYGLLE
jgi:hypothetical protein